MFRTSATLFEALTTFGEPAVEVEEKRKYAKFRALYIAKCIKEGTRPEPPEDLSSEPGLDTDMMDAPPSGYSEAPPAGFAAQDDPFARMGKQSVSPPPPPQSASPFGQPGRANPSAPPLPSSDDLCIRSLVPPQTFIEANRQTSHDLTRMPTHLQNTTNPTQPEVYLPTPPTHPVWAPSPPPQVPTPPPAAPAPRGYDPQVNATYPQNTGARRPKDMSQLNAEDIKRVNKLTRFVQSALQYDDVPTAVKNLEEALALLTH